MPPPIVDIERILQILPHRWPFVLVDRVTEIVDNELIRGHKCVSMGELWFQGHFPGRPIMPGVLILEALTQLGGILAYASDPFDPQNSLMYFLGIDKAKFRRVVTPGDRLDLEVTVVTTGQTSGSCEAKRASMARFAPRASSSPASFRGRGDDR